MKRRSDSLTEPLLNEIVDIFRLLGCRLVEQVHCLLTDSDIEGNLQVSDGATAIGRLMEKIRKQSQSEDL